MLTRVLILHAQSVDCTQGQISLSNCAEISGKFRNVIFILKILSGKWQFPRTEMLSLKVKQEYSKPYFSFWEFLCKRNFILLYVSTQWFLVNWYSLETKGFNFFNSAVIHWKSEHFFCLSSLLGISGVATLLPVGEGHAVADGPKIVQLGWREDHLLWSNKEWKLSERAFDEMEVWGGSHWWRKSLHLTRGCEHRWVVLPLTVVGDLGHLGGHWEPGQCLWDKDTFLGLGFTLQGGREGTIFSEPDGLPWILNHPKQA